MRRSSALAVLTAGCAATGAAAFVQAPGSAGARLFNSAPTAAARSPLRQFQAPALAKSKLNRSQRKAKLSSGVTTAKMVATDIFADVKDAPIMDKFEMVREETIEEYGAKVVLFRHKKTGAEIMSVIAPDENKVFGITFRTPPDDSTGIPHILEHSVLCGSRNYPVKEPFVELLKGSMQTFLNAMTYPDRTVYPVASQNLKDFYNLVNVYMDSVLHPSITPWTLKQEGWHYDIEDAKDPLTYKGVVYNEMKGVYSSPDSIHGRKCKEALFPDNTYGVDSGGDPVDIPNLTWEKFEGFHKKFYHPSNSRIYFYGDDPVPARLELIESYLSEFDNKPIAPEESVIGWQKKRDAPWSLEQFYPAGKDGKPLMTINWLLNESPFTPQEELALEVLNDLMVGTSTAPLYKKLRESGLGESVIASGLSTTLQQATFSIGMKGIKDKSQIGDIEKLTYDTIQELADTGFDEATIEAALNSLEFSLREFNTGGFPRGLSYMLGSMSNWLYGRDPMEALRFEKPLAELKARLSSGEPVFQDLLKKMLIDNTHRVTVTSLPDVQMEDKIRAAEIAELKAVRDKLTEDEIKELVKETLALKERQQAEDSPANLAKVPSLSMEDLDRKVRNVPITVGEEKGVTVLRHDLPTNGIVYADFGLDARVVPVDLLPLLPLFCRCLTEMGTTSKNDVELSKYIRTHTGGVGVSTSTTTKYGAGHTIPEPQVVSNVFMRGKATYAKSAEMFDVVSDILVNTNFDNKAKFKQMVLETKTRLESAAVSAGNSFASSRIGSRYEISEFIGAKMQGIDSLAGMAQLVEEIDSDWSSVLAKLHTLRDLLVDRRNLIVNLSAEEKGLNQVQARLEDYISSMPLREGDVKIQDWKAEMQKFEGAGEGFIVPTQVNYVGKGAQIYGVGDKTTGAASVVSRYLRTSWLWDKVRVVGGAYGCSNVFNPNTGLFKFTSYRDPNLVSTLKTYDETPSFLEHTAKEMSASTLSNAIIGMIGDLDKPMQPDQKGYASMDRYLTGLTDEIRQERRDQVLGTTAKDFKELGERLEAVAKSGTIAVIGSKTSLEGDDVKALGLDIKKLL